jgi:hypothetical protein
MEGTHMPEYEASALQSIPVAAKENTTDIVSTPLPSVSSSDLADEDIYEDF